MDKPCSRCEELVGDGVCCCSCLQSFHFACGGITEQGYRKLGERKSQWRCTTCKSAGKSSAKVAGIPVSPVPESTPTLENVMQELDKINLKLLPLLNLADDVRIIKKDVSELKTVAKTLTSQISLLEEKVKMVEDLKDEIGSLKVRVGVLEEEMNFKDQWLRANNVEIKGIPQKASENLFDIVGRIGTTITYPITKSNINFVTRIPSRDKGSNSKSILVSFLNKYTKEDFVAAARQKSFTPLDIGLQGSHRIYVNDHLTARNKQLLTKAKTLATENNFQFVWVKHSKIYARKNPTSPVLTITRESDLSKLSAKPNKQPDLALN